MLNLWGKGNETPRLCGKNTADKGGKKKRSATVPARRRKCAVPKKDGRARKKKEKLSCFLCSERRRVDGGEKKRMKRGRADWMSGAGLKTAPAKEKNRIVIRKEKKGTAGWGGTACRFRGEEEKKNLLAQMGGDS